jgi:propionyl-CoA synthetase
MSKFTSLIKSKKLTKPLSTFSICNRKNYSSYDTLYKDSINPSTRESFWANEAKELEWNKFPQTILDSKNKPFYRWFSDGEMNITYNMLDRNIKDNILANSPALIFESAYSDKKSPIILSYRELHNEVTKLCAVFKFKYNLNKGDRVIIFMPNIPEAVVSMLACARLGLIHSVVFGGFASEELALRIHDSKPKLIITASVGIEPKKKIPYYPIVRDALNHEKLLGQLPILIYQRENFYLEKNMANSDNYSIYQEEVEKYSNMKNEDLLVNLKSTDPLYILYTSGTTGAPKGICRDQGGTAVALNLAMKNIIGVDKKDTIFATSDIGWVVGHSFMVYGPLIRGATSLIYEGKPVGTPHAGRFWELCQKYNVNALYTSPTALRAIKKEDPDAKIFKSYNLDKKESILKSIHVAGERCDTDTIEWVKKGFGSEKLINDNWWQTETGWSMSSNYSRPEIFRSIPGSTCKPCPGYDIHIVEDECFKDEIPEGCDIKKENPPNIDVLKPNITGKVYVKLPMPPSFMLSLWGNDKAFIEKYISKDGQYYITGDAGHYDENGYLFIETRVDDVINVAGHRLSTGRIEEVIIQVPGVVESAVVSSKDEVKGEVPFAFVLCDEHADLSSEAKIKQMKEEIKNNVATHIGAISKLKDVIIVQRLPKTRSGKILRGVLKKILNKEIYKLPSTIEDPHVIDEIIQNLRDEKFI